MHFSIDLVIGSIRVPQPATGMIALVIVLIVLLYTNDMKIINFFRHYPLVAITLFVLLIGGGLSLAGQSEYTRYLFIIWGAVIVGRLGKDMIETLLSGRYGVDILAIVAIISTLAVGEVWASMIIVLMLTGGEALEEFAARRAKKELSALMERAPKIAHRKEKDGVVNVPIDQIVVGDILVIRPQEIIPTDGVLRSAAALIDESSLTGESRPIEYLKGDSLMSGSVNGDTAIEMTVTELASHSQYQQIIQLVEAASSTEAPFVRLADRYAVPFTLIAFMIAGLAWYLTGSAERFAQVLVVATPCPLILATPIALIAGMSRAAKRGIIIKSGAVIEKLASVHSAAFDKTGTLTHGKLAIDQILPVKGVTDDELLRLAATAEQQSTHIIAHALVEASAERGITPLAITKAKDVPAFGTEVITADGTILIGKRAFLEKAGVKKLPDTPSLTHVFVAKDGRYMGQILLQDEPRPESIDTLARLKNLGISNLTMLTGDGRQVANAIAAKLGLTDVRAECLPADKVNSVKDLAPRPVLMVGDGVNDAPVLAAADVGIAMGAKGSTAASESADVVIMLDDISRVADSVAISQRTINIAVQSVLAGIFLSIGLMIVAAFGYIPAVAGALLQELIDVAVIINALRALR